MMTLACGVLCIGAHALGLWFTSDALLFASVCAAGLTLLLAVLQVRSYRRWQTGLGLTLCGISALVWTALFPSLQRVRQALILEQTRQRVSQIAAALLQYSDSHPQRCLPPAATYDKDGRPLLSWRVLILPYLGHEEIYRQFNLSEPWDSPTNKRCLTLMPEVYALPGGPGLGDKPYKTFYQVFVGPGTAFEKAGGCQVPDDFSDGLSGTILVVEAAEPVPWTMPVDLPYSPKESLPKLGAVTGGYRGGFFFRRPSEACLAWGDAHATEILVEDIEESALRAAITRNDGKGGW